jgi:hypothetical protein
MLQSSRPAVLVGWFASPSLAIALVGCNWVIGSDSYAPYPEPPADVDANTHDVTQEGDAQEGDSQAPPPEECNFVDDDFDGLVDEGFAWQVGTWFEVAKVKNGREVRLARLPDGRVAIAASSGTVATDDAHVVVAIVTASGELIAGPVSLVPPEKLSGFGIAATRDAQVGVALGTNDGAGCAQGCPIVVARLDPATPDVYELKEVPYTMAANPKLRFLPQGLLDFTATTAGYVTLALDENGKGRLSWIDHLGDSFPNQWNGVLAGFSPTRGALSWGAMLAWAAVGETDGAQTEVLFGVTSPGGYTQYLSPSTVVGGAGGIPPEQAAGARSVCWSGSDVLVAITQRLVASDPQRALVLRMSTTTGKMEYSSFVSLEGRQAHSLVGIDGTIVATTTAAHDFDITRLDSALKPIDAPGQPIVVSDALGHAIVSEGFAPLVVRVVADGTRVEAARLECP